MPRKPNYKFARQERERAKAKKKAERLQAKLNKKAEKETPDSAEREADAGFSAENPLDTSRVEDEIV